MRSWCTQRIDTPLSQLSKKLARRSTTLNALQVDVLFFLSHNSCHSQWSCPSELKPNVLSGTNTTHAKDRWAIRYSRPTSRVSRPAESLPVHESATTLSLASTAGRDVEADHGGLVLQVYKLQCMALTCRSRARYCEASKCCFSSLLSLSYLPQLQAIPRSRS